MNVRKSKAPNIPILHEDNHLLVVEKPPGVLSQEDCTGAPDLLTLLKADLKERYNKPGNVYLGLVHRLDQPAGGVMVFAKTSKAASRLSDQIRKNAIQKTYLAVLCGVPLKRSGRLRHFLIKNRQTNTVEAFSHAIDHSKEAILEYTIVESAQDLSLAEVDLKTGRPHQIRVQFAALGHPLYGDQKYGRELNPPNRSLALWSTKLTLSHPVSKEIFVFHSAPPDVYPWNAFKIKKT